MKSALINAAPGKHFQTDTLKAMADDSKEMIFVVNADKVLYSNKACEDSLGYTKGEISAFTVGTGVIFPVPVIEEIQYMLDNSSTTRIRTSFECDFVSIKGRSLRSLLTLIPIKYNAQDALLFTVSDMLWKYGPEIKAEAQKPGERRRSTGYTQEDTVFTIDSDFRIELDNRRPKQITPDAAPEPVFNENTLNEYKWVFKNGKVLITEEVNSIDGREAYFETRKIPVFEAGKVTKIATVIKDVTITRSYEQELKTLNDKLVDSNSKLTKLAFTDSHTGLYNHQYLIETIDTEFSRAKRTGNSLSIVMMDIDNFKSINDVYGHQFGDLILSQFAQNIKRAARENDTPVRYGGEEFAVVCPGTDRISAILFGQRLIEEVSKGLFGNDKTHVRMTFSASIVAFPEDNVKNAIELMSLADQLLNKAKEYGGNRVYSSLDVKKITETGFEDNDAANMKEKIERLNKRMSQSMVEAVFAFAKTTSMKDNYSFELLEQIVYVAIKLAEKLNVPKEDINLIKQAVLLRDIGKVSINEKLLSKTEKLTNKEIALLKEHPIISADIIRPVHSLYNVLPFVLYHHENWDGSGYPLGMKGDEIPLGAQIVSIADTFQALISVRPYHKAYDRQQSVKILNENAGTRFDPNLVEKFISII